MKPSQAPAIPLSPQIPKSVLSPAKKKSEEVDDDSTKVVDTRMLRSWSRQLLNHLDDQLDQKGLAGKPQIHCKHRRGCVQNSILGGMKSFAIGVGIKVIVAMLRTLLSRRLPKLPTGIWGILNSDTFRFGYFIGTFAALYKAVNCFLRKILDEDNKLNGFIAGSISGLSILWLQREDRAAIAVYLFVRALKIVWDAASHQDWWPQTLNKIPEGDSLLFMFTACQVLYSYLLEPAALPANYMGFLLQAGRKDKRLLSFLKSRINGESVGGEGLASYCKDKGIDLLAILNNPPQPTPGSEPGFLTALQGHHASQNWPWCEVLHPKMSCNKHWVWFIIDHIINYSSRFYLPINIVSLILFQRQRLLVAPGASLFYALKSCAISSFFLSLYCGNAWRTACMLGNLHVFTRKNLYVVIGIGAGSAIFFEQKSRRMELALYCMSPALESAYRCLVGWGSIPPLPHAESASFAIAMGIIMMAHQTGGGHMEPTLSKITKALMGLN